MAIAPTQEAQLALEAIQSAELVERLIGTAWATDPTGRFVYFTPTAPMFRGLTLEQLNSSSDGASGWKRMIHPDDYGALALVWGQALQDGKSYAMDYRVLGMTGDYVWVHAAGQPLRDGEGRITGWYGCVINSAPCAITGRGSQGAPDMHMVHPHDRMAVTQASARAFITRTPQICTEVES